MARTARTKKSVPAGLPAPGAPVAMTEAASPATSPGRGTIRVRMYRVGFGDCFLLTLPGDRPHHVLIDCGVHSQGDIGTIGDAVDHIFTETGGQLDLVIATHAHQDHISGFARCAAAFGKFTVKEVWLPWTEDPNDPLAAQLRQKRDAVTHSLAMHLAAVGASAEAMAAINNLVGNEPALRLLKSGFHGGKVRYLQAGSSVKDGDGKEGHGQDVSGIPGLTARILGPPRDQRFLARLDPPSGDRYLRAADGGGTETVNALRPFENRWYAPADCLPAALLSEEDAEALRKMASDPESLAFALTSAMNNTSVVVLFSFAGHNLLFPGDAQYGNWQNWIDDPTAKTILANVDFYKVAHHGSVNATPKRAVEGMTQGRFAAMVSTQNTPWPSIPYGNLMAALIERSCGVARSDSIATPKSPGIGGGAPPPAFRPGKFWCDYEIAL